MLSDVKALYPKAPLTQVSPGVWHLRANLYVEEGATLLLHGTSIGGDVNELRLQSNNSPASNSIVNITADYGNINIRSTKITSWDDVVEGPDTDCAFSRAFIRARSKWDTNSLVALESRMDIIDSEVGYLGCHESEAYGLTWKVSGSPTNIIGLYDKVNVYGDIIRSHIHNNFFGMYSYGAYGMRMLENEVSHNAYYGFDPHDDSDYLVIENNNVHHNGTHGIIGSQRCDHMITRNNISWNNGGCGIMYHRYTDDGIIEGNKCLNNGDAGIAIFDSRRNLITNNTCWYNFKSAIRFSVGSADNLVISNDFGYGANFGIYLYKGNDAPKPGDDGRPKGNIFAYNRVHDNAGNAIYLTGADRNVFQGNIFMDNFGPMWFVKGNGNRLNGNVIPEDVLIRHQGTPFTPSTTTIRNQGVTSVQVDAYSSTTFEDFTGRVFEPEEGNIPNVMSTGGTSLTLTQAEIGKTSKIALRNLHATPDNGLALIGVGFWNTSGDLSKQWTVQAGSSTRTITYRIGDLAPSRTYDVVKNGSRTRLVTDELGFLTFQDRAVTTGVSQFSVRPSN